MLRNVRDEISDLAGLFRTLVVLAIAAAIWTEMRKPPAERSWHGKLIGFVPYDFRLPTLSRLRDAYWNPTSDRIFTDRPLGVGWAVNVPAVLRRAGVLSEQRPSTRAAARR